MTEIVRGLNGVVITETRLSSVDGARGELLLAGFRVEQLAPRASFEEVVYLLWHDRLPTVEECGALHRVLSAQRGLPADTVALLAAAARCAAPAMDALRMAVATLSLTDPDPRNTSADAQLQRAVGLVARFPTIVATYWRLRQGRTPVAPHPHLGHAANYLYMLTGEEPHAEEVRALDTYFNTVVDHGMNASTFTARVIVSTRSDMVSAVVGAVGALKGPLHGGAPGPALDMVFAIQERALRNRRSVAAEADAWARELLATGGRIMGFGHRVYHVRDPRADVLGAAARRLFERAGDTQLYEDARIVEDVVLRLLREHKPGRGLETNMEYYTALLLRGIGLDAELFTPTFAISRAAGWTAHILEQMAEDRLIRPSVAYVGPRDREWIPLDARPSAGVACGPQIRGCPRVEEIHG